jgi:hypothetical protein
LRANTFEGRWNDGLGAGGCAKMAVLSWKESKFFFAAIVGFLGQAIAETIECLQTDDLDPDEDTIMVSLVESER